MTDAPERIWIDKWGGKWSHVSGGTQDIEYTRSDLIPAMLAEAEQRGRDECMAALSDRNAVHLNMLRGAIANPTIDQIIHIYGADVLDAAIRARGGVNG